MAGSTSGSGSGPSKVDELQRLRDVGDRKLARWLMWIGVLVGLVQVPINLMEGRDTLAWSFAGFAAVLAGGELVLGRAVRPHRLALAGLVAVFGIELWGGVLILREGLTAYMPWIFVFVPVAIPVAGLAMGVSLCVALAAWLVAWFYVLDTQVPAAMFDEMLFAFVAVVGVMGLYEALRRFYERLLARLHGRLGELAAIDQLTRVYNRHTIHGLLRQELHRVRDGAPAFSVVLFDLDHFKRINDTLGHEAGDRVLRAVAETTTASIRASDTLGRWGGEEFLVLCSGATVDEAADVAERIRANLAAQAIEAVGSVTASFGVARLLAEDSIGDVVRRADEALYSAKHDGRNAVRGSRPAAPNVSTPSSLPSVPSGGES